jgi:hypothetical protein
MIKFNIKNFFKGNVEQESGIEVEVQLTPESRKEAFDKAVETETKNLLKEDIGKALFILVYGEEAWNQTVAFSSDPEGRTAKKYPKARVTWEYSGDYYHASFKVEHEDLVNYLVDRALEIPDEGLRRS